MGRLVITCNLQTGPCKLARWPRWLSLSIHVSELKFIIMNRVTWFTELLRVI